MTTKNKKSIATYFTIENALDTISFVNLMALSATEKGVMKGITLAEKSQNFTNKNIKKGLEFSAKQQNLMFETLDKSKAKIASLLNKK